MGGARVGESRPLLLGHRGCRGVEVENTFAAFDRALADGCDGFEFDVRRSLDGRNIICHDARLNRLEIAKHAFDKLRASSSRSRLGLRRSRTPNRELLCLEDVLERYGSSAFLDIELKVEGVEESALAAIGKTSGVRGYVISSFLPEVLRRLQQIDASVPTGYIFDERKAMKLWSELPCAWVMPHHKLVTQQLIHEFHAAGKQVMVWTVNSPNQMRRMAEFGVDAVIADDTGLLRDVLGAFVRYRR